MRNITIEEVGEILDLLNIAVVKDEWDKVEKAYRLMLNWEWRLAEDDET
jgi:hypothetical protein